MSAASQKFSVGMPQNSSDATLNDLIIVVLNFQSWYEQKSLKPSTVFESCYNLRATIIDDFMVFIYYQ